MKKEVKNSNKTAKTVKKKSKDKSKVNSNQKIVMRIFYLFLICLITLSISYSLFNSEKKTGNNYSIFIGNFSFDIGTEANPISLTATYPMVDAAGIRTTPYTFKITNSSKVKVNYTMELISDTVNTLPDNLIKIYIEQGSNIVGPKTLQELTRTIYSGTMTAGATQNFAIRLWLHENATTAVSGKSFKGKIKVTATQATQ